MLRKWGMLVLALLITPALAFAQNTGKVAGVVTDGETGEPLPGASVVLLGTQQGTISDVDGNYFIIGVPVGTYDVQASFVGYANSTVTGVEVSSGYTREINFVLNPGVELGEIIVEYERPLIQKDAVGVPKIVSAEEIVNLPVRGATAVASIQAGVVNKEGTGTLNVRGGRGAEVDYYIDGVKVIGTNALPQSAVQEQEMIIGNISAKYGDAMSGIISITTKSGAQQFFGSFEGITSNFTDPYDYNLLSGAIGGPIAGNKAGFFFSGEFTDWGDSGPRAFGELRIGDALLADLEAAPQAFRVNVFSCADGSDPNAGCLDGSDPVFESTDYLAITADLPDQSRLIVDDDGNPLVQDGLLMFETPVWQLNAETGRMEIVGYEDGPTVEVPEGADYENMSIFPFQRAEWDVDPDSDYEVAKAKRNRDYQRISLAANLDFNVLENAKLRVGGRYVNDDFVGGGAGGTLSPYSVNFPDTYIRNDFQVFATWTHYLSASTFFQVQGDYSDRSGANWDPRFNDSEPSDLNDLWAYADFDDAAQFSTLRGYKKVDFTEDTRIDDHGTPDDTSDDTEFTVQVPTYSYVYRDGSGPTFDVVASLVGPVGGAFNGYGKFHNKQLRFSATATTQVGLHQIEFGGEYESRENRSYTVGTAGLARLRDDFSGPEGIAADATDLNTEGYTDIYDIPLWKWDELAGGYGYDLYGNETDAEDFEGYIKKDKAKPMAERILAPNKPLYYGGYVQDKIEFRDIVLNLGLRVDVFDNNQRVIKDRFQRRPACRAADLGTVVTIDQGGLQQTTDCGAVPAGGVPSAIGSDYTVFYSGDSVIGYRDTQGGFYDPNGQVANAGDILLAGNPRNTFGDITPDMFTDYEPQVTVMPRIGVSFPVTDQALFFARYGVTSQRPSSNTFVTLGSFAGTGGMGNSNLKPEKTTEYELGFRQRVGARAALTISGFFRQIENLIQLREIRGSTPSVYSSYENVDFGTVKGIEFGFDLRRTGGVTANVNYTLSFADGTGSSNTTTGTIVWVDETPPNFISPLDFDQRHKLNVNIDYRMGKGEGPEVGGMRILENFGANILFTGGSGYPYTPVVEPFNLAGAARAAAPAGGVNSGRMPWSSRVDLRVDRRFEVGSNATVTAFVNVQNLFDQVNTNNVWRFTGLPDDDGFLSTSEGARFLEDRPPVAGALYHHRNRGLGNVGIPRITRVGLRLDF